MNNNPLLIVISGPSGVGKDAILNRMKKSHCPFSFITTVTTRSIRKGEINGVDYDFVSIGEFDNMLRNQELLEHAEVYGNWYGVPQKKVKEALSNNHDTIIKIDIQGAKTIKKLVPEAVFIFVAPPSLEELIGRLRNRSTENQMEMEKRVSAAENEMSQPKMFDYVVVNEPNAIDKAISKILAIVVAEKCRVKPRLITL